MRDPERLPKLPRELGELWRECPELRLGQLLFAAVNPKELCPKLSAIEDRELLAKVATLVQNMHDPEIQYPTDRS